MGSVNGVSPRGFTYGLYCYVSWNTQGHGETYEIPQPSQSFWIDHCTLALKNINPKGLTPN
jgi:hypothetical protein